MFGRICHYYATTCKSSHTNKELKQSYLPAKRKSQVLNKMRADFCIKNQNSKVTTEFQHAQKGLIENKYMALEIKSFKRETWTLPNLISFHFSF